MTEGPTEQQAAASEFYEALGFDVSYFPAIWHTYKVGHLLMADLDRICMAQGLSMADVHLMGAVRLDPSGHLRASDLARTLQLSNAVLSTRIAKLERKGLVARAGNPDDRRAHLLALTLKGIAVLDAAIEAVGKKARFVKSYGRLPQQDRTDLARIMGELHDDLDRDFVPVVRKDP
jgi:DNA-binding MarR family transcriptional regulator